MSRRVPAASEGELRLTVDPIACDGAGLCAELLPELVSLDDWGYPILHPRSVSGPLEDSARQAENLCPKLALRLQLLPVNSAGARRDARGWRAGCANLVEGR